MRFKRGLVFFSYCVLLVFAGPVQAASDEEQESEEPQSYLIEPVREISGPKRTVTVGGFQSTGAFVAKYGDWDVGGGLAAMLTSALVDSDRFIVVERAAISDCAECSIFSILW